LPQFYAMNIRKKHIVSRYDGSGAKISDVETYIDERRTGLPYQAVARFKADFPDAFVSMERDYSGQETTRFDHGAGFSRDKVERKGQKPAASWTRSKPAPAPASGIMSPSMSSVINAAIATEAE
jgi:hypothetical protein